MMRQIRKAHADIPEDALNQALGQPTLAKWKSHTNNQWKNS
jgi:hypothetical protein